MKARVSSGPILSICMIVKNEERHLENCLSALAPLRAAIESELIIADTGSSDNTLEIARRYTGQVFPYKSSGSFDFSEARNFSVSHARGKWVLNVDADEYLADPAPLLAFFASKSLNQYQSATVVIRNYFEGEQNNYSDFFGVRLIRREHCVYKGTIHEVLPILRPMYQIPVVFHHYGYTFQTQKEYEEKQRRNQEPLLAELEQSPEDTRLLVLLANSYPPRRAMPLLKKALSIERQAHSPEHRSFASPAFYYSITYSFQLEQYGEVLRLAKEYKEHPQWVEQSGSAGDVYAMLAFSNNAVGMYQQALDCYRLYEGIFRRFQAGELQSEDLLRQSAKYLNPIRFAEITFTAAVPSLAALGEFDKAEALLFSVDITGLPFFIFRFFLDALYDFCYKANREPLLAEVYAGYATQGEETRAALTAESLLERYYHAFPERRDAFTAAFEPFCEATDPVLRLYHLLSQRQAPDFPARLQALLDSVESWQPGMLEGLYLGLLTGTDLTVCLSRMDSETIHSAALTLSDAHWDFTELLVSYPHLSALSESIRGLCFLVAFFQQAVLHQDQTEPSERLAVVNSFLDYLIILVSTIYVTELLNPDDLPVLPELHRFGYYLGIGRLLEQEGNVIGALRMIHQALKVCEPMKNAVALLLQDFEQRHQLSPQ